jgi:hypothetical protein
MNNSSIRQILLASVIQVLLSTWITKNDELFTSER